VDITATVNAIGGPLSGGIVNIEIRDAAGAKVGQQIASGQSFFYGQSRSYQYTWTVPAPGTYSVKIGVSNASWYGYHWNSAASIQGAEPAPSADSAIYSFESSAQSWTSTGTIIKGVSASSTRAWAGKQSLAVSMAGTASANGVVHVLSPGAPVGSTITFRLWLPPGHRISGVQPFVQEDGAGGWRWTDKWYASSALVAGAWNTLTVQVPTDAVVPLHRLGLKLYTDATWTDTLAVDSVSW
jgi:hypothetical protein